MRRVKEKTENRFRRHKRVRAKIKGTAGRPRLAVFRSNKHTYAQLIDDENGTTLVHAESGNMNGTKELDKAKKVGEEIAKQAKAKKITEAVFDRGGFLFAGKVRAVAEGAREGGLKI